MNVIFVIKNNVELSNVCGFYWGAKVSFVSIIQNEATIQLLAL